MNVQETLILQPKRENWLSFVFIENDSSLRKKVQQPSNMQPTSVWLTKVQMYVAGFAASFMVENSVNIKLKILKPQFSRQHLFSIFIWVNDGVWCYRKNALWKLEKNGRLNCIQFDEIQTEAKQIRIHIPIEVVKTAPTKCKLDKMS